MRIGVPLVFSGKAPQVEFLAKVLKKLGFNIITTKITTPALWESALFLGSNETCLPVKIYIAHCHQLIYEKKVDVLLAPNLWREVEDSAACAKYRDVGGIALRALSSTTDYALGKFPILVQPNLLSPKKEDLLPVINIIIQELNIASAKTGKPIPILSKKTIKQAFFSIPNYRITKEPVLEDKPRLGLIGRRYLLEDPLLSLNIKNFFQKKGFQVLSPYDLPNSYFHKEGMPIGSYYDTHIQGEQFLRWGQNKIAGVVILSNFACHPDAFQGQYFEAKAKELGLLSWHFVCDSTADLGGFITRFETIAALLKLEKPAREKKPQPLYLKRESSPIKKKTFITWPYMGEPLNLSIKQLAFDLGVSDLCLVPKPITAETLKRGSQDFAETCCPYALVSGCLEETILEAYSKHQTPLDIKILMLHGEGPCAFGWYSIAMREKLPLRLKRVTPDISLNWLTTGLDQPASFWQELAQLCHPEIARFFTGIKTPLSFLKPLNISLALSLARNALIKLRLAEDLRALYLLARPFGGKVATEIYTTALVNLDKAKTIPLMQQNFRKSMAIFQSLTQEKKAPQVIVVGEIYVAITPYANRYTVDNLLGDAGMQVIEGVGISHYLLCSLKPVLYKLFGNLGLIKLLNKQGLKLFAQGLRDNDAAPFMNFEVGGDGVLSTGAARRALKSGAQGIVHIYPLNCMPEVVAKPALQELSQLYQVPYLGLSFNRETDTERLMTEVLTFTRLIFSRQKLGAI